MRLFYLIFPLVLSLSCTGFQTSHVSARINIVTDKVSIYGTAFLVENHLLTAGHICEDILKQKTTATLTYIDTNGQVQEGGSFFPKKVSKKHDICELGTLVPVTHKMKNLRLRSGTIPLGEHVWVVGAPRGIFPVITDGYVTGHSEDILWTSTPVTGGNSGSPVLDDYGAVVGLVIAVDTRYHHISLSVPGSLLREFFNELN